jgi:creatinine amidohydrolase
VDYHGGEAETPHTLISAPGLVHPDRAGQEFGADQGRLKLPDGVYTGIWWYASFPNHYSGDVSLASKELGAYDTRSEVDAIANVIRAVKADTESLKLQQQFFQDAAHPLATKQ